jgi:hypothetical protein
MNTETNTEKRPRGRPRGTIKQKKGQYLWVKAELVDVTKSFIETIESQQTRANENKSVM